ncbi:MAG: septum site-determining protein MinC [Chloroflexi bacterium]|nr:septum site-determining protein MinC [Chloroflexota bacterium]
MTDENTAQVQIKGIREGLLVTLTGESWPDKKNALLAQIENQPSFFQGARLALDVGSQSLKVAELSALRDLLSEKGISLWALLSESPRSEQTAQNLGLATRISKPRPQEVRTAPEITPDTALWVRQTVRSGTRIEYPSHIVVLGDVNPGGEIVAAGSVIVWGRLRGMVHAGAEGDEQAVVCALELAPAQLRIAGQMAVSPMTEGRDQPGMARLKDGQLLAEPW